MKRHPIYHCFYSWIWWRGSFG